MSDVLFDTFKEHSRIEEALCITEDGLYAKGRVPDSYGGMVIDINVVHTIHLVNSVGTMISLEFHNEAPKNKDNTTTPGSVTVDGVAPVAPDNGYNLSGAGETRRWVTKTSTQLAGKAKTAGDFTMSRRNIR